MSKEELREMLQELSLNEQIELESIPNLDLYMDQVITLFEDKLGHTKRYESDKLLTKTMINNYTKDKLLMPAVKKKYTKPHILLMILLYDLKQILTIGDIKSLFGTLIKEDKVDEALLNQVYQIFLEAKLKAADEFKNESSQINDDMNELTSRLIYENDGIDENKLSSMLQVIILTEKANYYKRLAEKLIDEKINK